MVVVVLVIVMVHPAPQLDQAQVAMMALVIVTAAVRNAAVIRVSRYAYRS
jgi:hypothetical protein